MSAASEKDSHEDFLDADSEIPGQKFCLLSFLSPEKVLANKDIFMFSKFMESYEFVSRTKNLEAYLMRTVATFNDKLDKEADELLAKDLSGASDICRKSKIRMDLVMDEFQGFVKKNERELRESQLREAYDDFMYKNRTKLEDEFFAKNDFRTTVRGLKIRGAYGSQGEATARAKKLQRNDPMHNIFVAEVGKWLPWDPAPAEVGEQEYAEDQLNTLMKKYKENEEQREQFHREQRGRGRMQGSGSAPQSESGIRIVRETGTEGAAVGAEGAAVDSSVADMFSGSGPADLAIARKMEREGGGDGAK